MRNTWLGFFVLGLLTACSSSDSSSSDSLAGYLPNTGPGTGTGAGGSGSYGVGGGNNLVGASAGGNATGGQSAGDAAGAPSISPAAGNGGSAGNGAAGAVDTCALLDPSKPQVLYQSADDSNSMASPVLVRRLVRAGRPVSRELVRTYEFFNYYRFAYAPAEDGHVRVVTELRPADKAGSYTLQVGIVSPPAPAPRRPMNLTFVLDTSGSMGQDGRLERERAAFKAIAGQMQTGDQVSVVTWSDTQTVALDGYTAVGPNDPKLVAFAESIATNGGTNLSAGLTKGYQLAQSHYAKELMNRVIMISDGEANIGETDGAIIGNASHASDDEGIYLVGVNVGGELGDPLMNIVTDKGRGASVFLDTIDEANAMFGGRFEETMEIAARDVRLELTLPWYLTLDGFSGEQSSIDPKHVDPQHLSPNDAMVFHETFIACSTDKLATTDTVSAKATWLTPIAHEARSDESSGTIDSLLAAPADNLGKGAAIYAYAEALKTAGAGRTDAGRTALEDALKKVGEADPSGSDPDLSEIAGLLTAYLAYY